MLYDSSLKSSDLHSLTAFRTMIKQFIVILKKINRTLIINRREPQVKRKCDRFGKYYWQVYEPISGSYLFFNSEREVKVWLDTRYHH